MLIAWPSSQMLVNLIFCHYAQRLSCQLDPRMVSWLEMRQNAWLLILPHTQLSSLAGVKPGYLLKIPPAQIAFLSSPKSSLSFAAIQDPEQSDLLVSHPVILLSWGKFSVSHLSLKCLFSLKIENCTSVWLSVLPIICLTLQLYSWGNVGW